MGAELSYYIGPYLRIAQPVEVEVVKGNRCTNTECRRRYAITDDIPVMLIDESAVLESDDFQTAMSKRPAD